MKPLKNTDYEVVSNLRGREIALDFDPAARVHLMNVMTNMYLDKRMAALREYTTNARDAHVEAGITDPIEVTLPDRFEPTLRIRDYGNGLDLDDIQNVYSLYGASTKRDTNEQTGAFGLGSKAGLAYANQFSVTSVKDGLKHRMTVHRDAGGSSTITVTSGEGEETHDRSGVEIEIPAGRWDTFENEARRLFRFWDEGTVLVNGEHPERVDGMWLGDDLVLTQTGSDDSYIVMGGVPYPIEFESIEFKDGWSLVAFVPIGTVEPMYNRESLHQTPETKATIAKVEADFTAKIATQVQAEVDKATTTWGAIKTAQNWHSIVPASARANEYTYKGRKMPKLYQPKKPDGVPMPVIGVKYQASRLKDHDREVGGIPVESWPYSVWVTDHDPSDTFTATKKKKLLEWAKQQGLTDVRRFILTPQKQPHEVLRWTDPKMRVRWETIKAIKLARTYNGKTSTGRIPGSYDAFVGGDFESEVVANDIDTSEALFHFVGRKSEADDLVQLVTEDYPDATVVLLFVNRVGKFERNFPQSRPLGAVAREMHRDWYLGLPITNRLELQIAEPRISPPRWGGRTKHVYYYGSRDELQAIDPDRVDDPALRASARMARRDIEGLVDQMKRFTAVSHTLPEDPVKWKNPLPGYPLVEENEDLLRRHPDHTYLYINAAYAAGLTKEKK